jgi:hypothetical protein
MSADKTKAVLSIGIKMFPFQISYVKKCILSEMREEFLPCHGSPNFLVTGASWEDGSHSSTSWRHYQLPLNLGGPDKLAHVGNDILVM